jgi:hypothetical protein
VTPTRPQTTREAQAVAAGRRILVALLFCVLTTLEPAKAGAEIAAGVNGVAAAAEFSGTFTLQRFVSDAGRFVALGMLTDVPGVNATSRDTLEMIRIPVTAVSRSCEMLRVDLGPIDLNLQGPTVHVNEFSVHVSDPSSGPLGQSLCLVANAPDDVTTLVPLLNHLVNLVGCLMRGDEGCSRQPI